MIPSIDNVSSPTAISSPKPEKSFLQQAQECIQRSDFHEAIQLIILAIQESSEIEVLFDVLLELCPRSDWEHYRILIGNRPNLLADSSYLPDKQVKLALKLAE